MAATMSNWFVRRTPYFVELQRHVGCRFGVGIFPCGRVPFDTPAADVLRWWLAQEDLNPGEMIVFDGRVLQLSLQRGKG